MCNVISYVEHKIHIKLTRLSSCSPIPSSGVKGDDGFSASHLCMRSFNVHALSGGTRG